MPGTMGPRKVTFDNYTVWCDFGADAGMITEVIDVLLHDLPVSVDTLLAGVACGDYAAVARAAHKVAGAAGTVAAEPICTLARRIEAHAKQESMTAVSALCAPISEARDRLMTELMIWRDEISPLASARA